jgi:O-antigen/teichoic acid export membrane protein
MKQHSRNFLSIIFSDLGRRGFGFLTFAYLARKLGPSDFGAINVGFTVLSYATMTAAGGLSVFGTRAVAKGEGAQLAGALAGARLLNSLAVLLIVGCILLAVPNAVTATLILLFCISLIPNALNLDWFFQGKEAMASIGAARTLSAATYFILVVALVRTPADIFLVAVAAVIGDSAAAALLAANFRRRFPSEGMRPVFSGWKSLTLNSFPLGMGSLLAHASVNLPPLVLGIVMTNSDAGIYSAAGKLVTFLLVIDRVISTILLPASARKFGQSAQALSGILNRSLKWMIIVALPLCVGGSILGGRLIELVFGERFLAAGEVFSVLIWFFLATLLHTVYTTGLIASGQEKLYGRIMMISAGIYLFFTVGLTILYGPAGSAAAVVWSEAIAVIIMARQLKPFVRIELPRSAAGSLAAAVGMAVALVLLSSFPLWLSIVACAIVYILLLFATRAIGRSDLTELLGTV